jgi:hypothetical protein
LGSMLNVLVSPSLGVKVRLSGTRVLLVTRLASETMKSGVPVHNAFTARVAEISPSNSLPNVFVDGVKARAVGAHATMVWSNEAVMAA